MFYTGRRVGGEEAARIGLANICVPHDHVRAEAVKLAIEIAECAPLAIISTRKTMRGNLADRVMTATAHQQQEQTWLRATEDFQEGVKAGSERRAANWKAAKDKSLAVKVPATAFQNRHLPHARFGCRLNRSTV
jgi:enoyl-CoA hydratase/carnithine racemase